VASYHLLPGNGRGLFLKEEIDKSGSKQVRQKAKGKKNI